MEERLQASKLIDSLLQNKKILPEDVPKLEGLCPFPVDRVIGMVSVIHQINGLYRMDDLIDAINHSKARSIEGRIPVCKI